MKKLILFILLLTSFKAFAQYPKPGGTLLPFGSAQHFYEIVGGDTLVWSKSSNGLWFPIGRRSVSYFDHNFTKPDSVIHLAPIINMTDWKFKSVSSSLPALTLLSPNATGYIFQIKDTVGNLGVGMSFSTMFAHEYHYWRGQNYAALNMSDSGSTMFHNVPNGYFMTWADSSKTYARFDRYALYNYTDSTHMGGSPKAIPTVEFVLNRIRNYGGGGGGGTIHTGSGLSGDGSSGTPAILGGTLTTDADITTGATNEFFVSSTSSSNTASLKLQSGILNAIFAKSSAGRSLLNLAVNGSTPQAIIGYENQAANRHKELIFGTNNNGIKTIEDVDSIGFDYSGISSVKQRLRRSTVPSIGTTILLIDSVKGTISGGTTAHPLTLGYGLTGTSFDGSTSITTNVDTSSSGLLTYNNLFPRADTRYYKASNPSGYISGNQTISFAPTGDVTGSTTGTTSLTPALSIGAGKVVNSMIASGTIDPTTKLSTTGTPSSSTYLRGDNTWATVASPLTAGRGILLPSAAIMLDTTQNYTWLKAQTITKNGIATTATDALNLLNATASTSGVKDQYSPSLHFGGHTRNSSADVFVDWGMDVKTINGATPISYIDIFASHSGTSTQSYTHLYTFDNSGNFSSVGNISTAAGKSVTTTNFFTSNAQVTTSLQTPVVTTNAVNTTLNLGQATTFSAAGIIVDINPNSGGNTITNSTGTVVTLGIDNTYNQTSAGAGIDLKIRSIETALGSGGHKFVSFLGGASGLTEKFYVLNDGTINSQSLTASKVVFTDASKNLTSTGIGSATQLLAGDGSLVTGSITQATNDLTAQTSVGNITTFTVGASTATFNVSAYLNITAISTDVIKTQVTYTDENSTSQTANFYTQGATLADLSTTGNTEYSPMTIRAKNGTTITVKTTLTTSGGSITFDAGARITQL